MLYRTTVFVACLMGLVSAHGGMLKDTDFNTSRAVNTAVPSKTHWANLAPHPRLLAGAARFEALRSQDDLVSNQLKLLLQQQAGASLTASPIVYPTTGIRHSAMREVQRRILALALSFRLTDNREHLERARLELLRLAALPDWGPSHFLGVGEAALAAGIGMDWMYDELSTDERNLIAQAIVANAIHPSLEVATGANTWVDGDFNWTQVCHAGVVTSALAIAEREPDLARRVVERAVNNFGNVGATYAPDGAYAEGPSYWSYGTSFHVILIEALRSALGTSCGLETFPGFLQSGEYNNQMVAPSGEDFNYSDYHLEDLNEPIMLWYARELRDRDLARDEFADLARAAKKATHVRSETQQKDVAVSRHLPFELIWWDASLPVIQNARSHHWTATGVLPLAVMRSAWDDQSASFVAVKGGTPNHSHAHMDVGSFILEADGVRWAVDLGTESYDKMRAARLDLWNYSQDSSRWTTFRVGPEGHNILRFDGARQDVTGKAEIRILPVSDGSFGNVVDLTPLYRSHVAHVERAVRLHPDRSISIVDTWTAVDRDVTATWQWHTLAQVSRTPEGLLLEQAGKSLKLRIESPLTATIEVEDVSAPRAPQDSPNPGLSRIVIRLSTPANATTRLHVLAIPGSASDPHLLQP
jgi:hypothetical protein